MRNDPISEAVKAIIADTTMNKTKNIVDNTASTFLPFI
jgi:hypothetical protein